MCLYQNHVHFVYKIDNKHKQVIRKANYNLLLFKITLLLYLTLSLCVGTTFALSRPTYLLFANRKDIRLVNADTRSNATIIVGQLEDAAAIDFYFAESIIFWTDIGLEVIKGIKINGSSRSEFNIISTGIISPDGLACDWLTRKLYWTDSESNRIEVSTFDGSHRKVLFWENLDQPRGIALVPDEGFMFWSDWGEVPKIERASMDGSVATRTVIVNNNIYWPNGLTIDYEAKRVYWADAKLKFISSMDFSGNSRKTVVHGNLPHPFALTIIGDWIYWTDWLNKAILTCNKQSGAKKRQVLGNLTPMGIHVYSAARQLPKSTECDTNNGGCSHLCLLSSNYPYYSCACPTGVRLLNDGKRCSNSAEQILLLARRVDIRRISLDTPDHTDVVLPLRGIKHVIALDYDPVEGRIYWTDDDVHVIRRAFLNGSDQEDLVSTEVHHPDGIAIDWIARNLYWTDTGTDRIEVARLNGTSRKILLTEGLDEPRAIVVHPVRGWMYWTDWGAKAKIERAALDGTDRSVIINNSLGWPNGLAIDYDSSKVYWCDAKLDKIEMANFDGSNRKELITDQLPHIFGFTILGDSVYWTDWQRRSVERANKLDGSQREIIVDQLPDLMGLKAISVNKVLGTNPCAENNGNCSHLCLYRPNLSFVCACPMGYELATDLQTCIIPEAFLLFSRRADIRRISLASHHLDLIPIAGIQEASAFDYDINDNRIYWTDVKLKMISRAFMNGSNIEHIMEFGLEYPEGIAVDWVAHNLYWADTEFNRIEVSRLDGSSRKVLIWKDLDNPRSIALNPSEGYMYWSDWGADPRIESAALDGTKRITIIEKIGRANGLAIDFTDRRIYWTDIDSHVIESSELDGSNRILIISDDLPKPYGLTVFQDNVFWTDWQTSTIERANKTNGMNRTQIHDKLDYVVDIVVFHNSRQSGWNPCAVNNGGCSNLCLAVPSANQRAYEHYCACPTHYKINQDNKTCNAPEDFLMYSQKNSITRFIVDSMSDAPDISLPLHGLKNVKAIAYDPFEQFLYWIGGRTLAIKRGHDNGTGNSIFIPNPQELNSPYDIEVDPYSRLLFWSCAHYNSINITRLDGRYIGTLHNDPMDRPRSLALHYKKGYLFWVNQISPPKIERSLIGGFERKVVVENHLEDVNALAVDLDKENELIYWADGAHKKIECALFDGSERRMLVNDVQANALAVHGKYLYWIEREQRTIERIDKIRGSSQQSIYNRISHLTNLIAVVPVESKISLQECQLDNAGCSHMCLTNHDGGSRRCACPQGLILQNDERTCNNPPTCSPDHFACFSGEKKCIPNVWRCDGTPECDDKSDELNCPQCPETQFRCPRNSFEESKCIDQNALCDGINDCFDGFDEQCCSKNEFRCHQGRTCLQLFHVCDGKADCLDGSDETSGSCKNKANFAPIPSESDSGKTHNYIVSFGLAILIMLLIIFLTVICKRKPAVTYEENDDNYDATQILMGTRPPNPQIAERRGQLLSSNENMLSKRIPVGPGSACPTQNDPLYDRNVTGASSSSSSGPNNNAGYPKETLNPPPSPVTDQSQCNFEDSSCSQVHSRSSRSAILPNHKKRWTHKSRAPPPPTPCSTDFESEPTPIKYNYYDNSNAYDSDLNAPPPSPFSHYISDFSAPPSPGTERSYYHLPPPPPSPDPETDDLP